MPELSPSFPERTGKVLIFHQHEASCFLSSGSLLVKAEHIQSTLFLG